MSQYLYAIIPYNSGMDFSSSEEPFIWEPHVPEFEDVDSELTEEDGLQLYSEYITINTCARMSWLKCDENGYCWIRSEIYKLAKAVGAKEVWYIEELCHDDIEIKGPTIEEFKRQLANEFNYCTKEVNIDMLKDNSYASYCHDDFSDVVLEKVQ